MTGQDADKVQAQMDRDLPGPDVMLRLWASWMDQLSAPAKALADPGTAWWQMTTDSPASGLIAGGVDQFQRSLSQDPTLRSIDQM
jgi:polyhydroxyalkanoate synthase